MTHIETHIIIDAPPEKVRDVLFNYQDYKNWNPFFVSFQKYTNTKVPELHVGDELQIDMKLKDTHHTSTMYPKILEKTDYKLKWKGVLLSAWVFYGVHTFEIDPLNDEEEEEEDNDSNKDDDNDASLVKHKDSHVHQVKTARAKSAAKTAQKTIFGQLEQFGGLLVYVLQILGVYRKTQESFKLFNEALKEQVEKSLWVLFA